MTYSFKPQFAFIKPLIGSVICSAFLLGCQYQPTSDIKDKVLVYCSEGSPQTFNPQLTTSGTTFDASSRTIYNRLVEFNKSSTQIVPALAESWKITNQGKTYTFKLRKNVSFHHTALFKPTRHFNASDVVFSFNRQADNTHPFHAVSGTSYRYFNAMGLKQLITKIEVIDSHTLKFQLSRAEGPFLSILAMDFASILSNEYADQLLQQNTPEKIDQYPVGTGPFQLIRYQSDAYIRYQSHPNYWKGKEKLDSLVFAITPNPSLRFARLVAGECDVMANPLPIQTSAAENFEHLKVLDSLGLNIAFLSLNTRKHPFNNKKVRLAINYAINKDAILEAVYLNTASKAKNPIPPGLWSYNQTTQELSYNPEKAKALLAETGFSQGFDMSIWTMSAQRAYNPNAKKNGRTYSAKP